MSVTRRWIHSDWQIVPRYSGQDSASLDLFRLGAGRPGRRHDEPQLAIYIARGRIAREVIQRPAVICHLSRTIRARDRAQHAGLDTSSTVGSCVDGSDSWSSLRQERYPGRSTSASAVACIRRSVLAKGIEGHSFSIDEVVTKDLAVAQIHYRRPTGSARRAARRPGRSS